jgi:hypothetical protein
MADHRLESSTSVGQEQHLTHASPIHRLSNPMGGEYPTANWVTAVRRFQIGMFPTSAPSVRRGYDGALNTRTGALGFPLARLCVH